MVEVAAAIIRDGDKILICQRANDDDCGMLWEFPGGKREIGETLEQCIVREMREELDLDIIIQSIFAKTHYPFNGRDIYFTFFNAEIAGGEMVLNVHNAAKWVSPFELGEYEFMPPDVEIVRNLWKA